MTRQGVVAQAVSLADADGVGALSMRALATRLGVEAMSLYHHVGSKDVLLDAMVDAVFAEIHLPVVGAPWRVEMRRRGVSGRAALLRHRWAVGLMDSRRQPGPATMAHHDAVIGCLLRDGFDLPGTATAVALLDAQLYGFVLQEVALPFETPGELAQIGADILGEQARAAYPHFAAFADGHALQPGFAFADEFEPTLDLALDAVAGLRRAL
nr:TetR/AcrR family transcriptional regulator C-terminal domain-containing protein [Kineosphaera limosa]